ncbi:MAG TPA: hypothetical protein VM033_03985 [Gemmatimonadaceae bacterium]|nr:hypothetical protein [Gemmatimonadaceae bacterium]
MTDRARQAVCMLRRVAVSAVLLVAAHSSAGAQRADSARVAARMPAADTAKRVVPVSPISPRRAFLSSLILPGYSQSVLGRSTAGAIFVLSESIAIAMLRESKADLNEARNLRRDSLVVIGFETNGTEIKAPAAYTDELVNVRKGHVEDWVAFLIANHLFAAADAYVGAHLWDLPSQISLRRTPGSTILAARLAW